MKIQKITPFLWFNNQAEEAVKFYISLFKNSKILNVFKFGEGDPGPGGSVTTVNFTLDGQEFVALNGGPMFTFSPAISFVVNCESQEEVDFYWEKLSEEGQKQPCGWLIDKYGVSWQIVPTILFRLLYHPDPVKAQKVSEAMLKMSKLDIRTLETAAGNPVIVEELLNAPVKAVWRAMTDTSEMKKWYFEIANFIPEKGFTFTFTGKSDSREYLHLCEITEVQPDRKLAYSWRYEGFEGLSHVTFELIPEGEQTRIVLCHDDLGTFPKDDKDFSRDSFLQGWTYIIKTSLPGHLTHPSN